MTTIEVLHDLRARDIRLTMNGNRLAYDAPEDAITDEVLTLLRRHKQGLLALLAQPAPANAATTVPSTQEACRDQEPIPPPLYPGHPVGMPFRPGQQVWLYRWDNHAPRFAIPVTIVQMRTHGLGEEDIGWRSIGGAVTWHNARLAVAVET